MENRSISDTLDAIIGDVPVSEQIAAAIERMAPKDHAHNDCATRTEVEELKKKIEALMDLVGDTSVANQIAAAIINNK